MAPTPPPLLLALAHAVDAAVLTAIRASRPNAATTVAALQHVPADAARHVLGPADAADELASIGIAVERRGILLRPAGRIDDEVIARLADRGMGPAPVTVLELTGLLEHAARCGPMHAEGAAGALMKQLDFAAAVLRAGDEPELWLVGLGAPHAVDTTFDVVTAWHRHIVPPLANELHGTATASELRVQADNQRALDIAIAMLRRGPFAAHGEVASDRPGRLILRARSGVAFGQRRVLARAPHAGEATAAVLRPGRRVEPAAIPFDELIASFWMRAAVLHARHDDEIAATRRDARPVQHETPSLDPAPVSSETTTTRR